MSPRYAIYYTPPPSSALACFGASVIGYDCFDAVEVSRMRLNGIDPNVHKLVTVDPRRYGFHATIIAPFHLQGGSEEELIAAASDYATQVRPMRLGSLVVSTIGDFIALVPAEANEDLSKFAMKCLKAFDRYRVPLTASDRERRLKSKLSDHQIELMDRWGYPYVLDEYRFHMTLTGALPENLRDMLCGALTHAFADRVADTFELDAISVMRQDDRDARFKVLRRCRLRG
jgi:putative phosphonate metabolism protein